MSEINITKHAEKRIRQRVGIPKKSVHNWVESALTEGVRSDSISGSFKRYLNSFQFNAGAASHGIGFNGFILLMKGHTVITVVHTPPKFRKIFLKGI